MNEMGNSKVTVSEYASHWTRDRVAQGLSSAGDEGVRLRLHAMPSIGLLCMEEVRPRHIRDLIRLLRAQSKLAPRSIRHVYGALHGMFRDAIIDELIQFTPCILKPGDLPKLIDKDPTWRAGAVFLRGELERLISDTRLPPDRRVLYALLGLAGLRFGEAAALRWRLYDSTLEPLGRLLIASSWCTTSRREKATKTEQPRLVPVHQVLVDVLDQWRRDGWRVMMGRDPTAGDLIIPSRRGLNRSRHHSLEKFHQDLVRLGMRRRRQHDLRRTFISVARTDGARVDVLERVTHSNRGDVMDLYTTLPWALLCEEVQRMRIAPIPARRFRWPGSYAPWAARAIERYPLPLPAAAR